jgi:hypothetical protein
VTFDNGPLLTQREGLQLADAAFGVALGHNPSSEIRNAALVGRARTALMLGNGADVVQYASQVPMDFVFWATYDDNPNRRQNYFYNAFFIGTSTSVGVKNRHLQFLGGVADPRVPIVKSTRTSAQAQNLPIWESHKYLSLGADIPIGTGREAMIMIAEVELGQTAVDIINQLRATPSTYVPENPSLFPNGWPDFPVFASTDPAEILAEVKDERRRETFLQGSEVGDLLRWGDPFPLGGDERGRAYDESNTCMHVPEFEEVANPNIETTPPRTPSL